MKLTFLLSRVLALTLLLGAGALAWAQADPPARVVYLSAIEGPARIEDAGVWAPAALNWPVTTGTRLQLDAGARLELDGGWLSLRLQGPAALDATALDDIHTQWALTQGSASLRVRDLPAGQRVELDTPQLALVATQPAEVRLDTDAASDSTRVTVRTGAITVYGAAGQAMTINAGQQVTFGARDLSVLGNAAAPPRDAFGQWVAARERLLQQSVSAGYLPPDMPGYQALDSYGQWAQDANYGPVWYPAVTALDWAPYRDGRWAWVAPWGWTWIDAAPWGFAPFHYGRWTQIGPRWAWVPGPRVHRPVYAPALVQFVGAGPGWSVTAGTGPGAAWFPLAPWENWQPPYAVSPRYRERVNDWGHWRTPPPRRPGDGYYFQHRPGAISVAPQGPLGFAPGAHGRPPRYGDASHLPAGWMQGARPIAPPPRPAFAPPGTRPPQGLPPPSVGVAPLRPMPPRPTPPPPGARPQPPAAPHNPPPPMAPGARPDFRPPAAMPPSPPRPQRNPDAGRGPERPPHGAAPPRDAAPQPPVNRAPRPQAHDRPPPQRPEFQGPLPRPQLQGAPAPRPQFHEPPPQRAQRAEPPPAREFTRPERARPQQERPPAHVERESRREPPQRPRGRGPDNQP